MPTAASKAELTALAASIGHPIYWAGAIHGDTYELTRTASGKVFIRYLPAGIAVGSPRASYLTVATYPFPNAFAAVEREAGLKGAVTFHLPGGGLAVVDQQLPEEHPPRLPGVRLPGRGVRPVASTHAPARLFWESQRDRVSRTSSGDREEEAAA